MSTSFLPQLHQLTSILLEDIVLLKLSSFRSQCIHNSPGTLKQSMIFFFFFWFIQDFLLLQQFSSFKNISINSLKLFSLPLDCGLEWGTHFWWIKYDKSDGMSPKTVASTLGRILSLACSLDQIVYFVRISFHVLRTFRQPVEGSWRNWVLQSTAMQWSYLEVDLYRWSLRWL